MKTRMFLCFHVKFKHESTRTCMFSCKFCAYFYLYITSQWYNDKGSIEGPTTTGIKDTPSQPFPSPPQFKTYCRWSPGDEALRWVGSGSR